MSATTGRPLRVTVLDAWDEIGFDAEPDMSLVELKAAALVRAGVSRPPEEYLIKYLGAELPEGATTVAEAGIEPNGALIVLRRHRSPVR
jgi:hypothetical protein